MTYSYRLIPLIIVGIVLMGIISAIAEEITLTTYYPAPTGNYNDLETETLTLTPGAAPPVAAGSELEGMFYFDNGTGTNPKGLYYCEEDAGGWTSLSGGAWTTAANGTNIYYDAGKVGIGTTDPRTLLGMESASDNVAIALDSPSNRQNSISFGMVQPGLSTQLKGSLIYNNNDNSLKLINLVGLQYISISSTGNVGIGTTSPAHDLHVSEDTPGEYSIIRLDNTDNTNGLSSAQLDIKTAGSSGGDPQVLFTIADAQDWGIGVDNDDSDKLKIDAPQGVLPYVGSGTVLTIKTDGNVGIGTTTPARTLHVASTDGMRIEPSALPATGAAGDIVIDSQDNNTLKWHNGTSWRRAGNNSAFTVCKDDVNQVVPKNSKNNHVLVDWSTEDFDTNDEFDLTTDRFKPKKPGKYFLTASVRMANKNLHRRVYIYKKETIVAYGIDKTASVSSAVRSISKLVSADGINDYFEVRVANGDTDNNRTLYADSTSTFFSGFKVAD